MKLDFNINGGVRVKLTDLGRALHRKKHSDLFAKYHAVERPYIPPVEDQDGWSEWQMWSLMQWFGEFIYLGCDPPFETTIQIIHADET